MRLAPSSDEGSATISIAIIFPVIAMLFLILAQTAMIAAARDVATAAAEEGLRIARAHHGTLTDGQAAATGFAHHEPVLLTPTATASGSTTITVTVGGYALSLLPGIHPAVSARVHGARETFTTETRRNTNSDGSPQANSPREDGR